MAIREMIGDDCRALLARSSFGRLGCSLEDQPYIVPISFVYEGDDPHFFATFGQKIKWMRANPKVCVQVDEIASPFQWQSVVVVGSYQELKEPQFELELAHARKLLDRPYRWWLNVLAERQLKSDEELIPPLFFRVRIESLSGLDSVSESEPAC